jgi:hypothetical protein
MKLIAVISHDNHYSVVFFVNWYNNELLQLIRQFFLIPNKINDFVDNILLHASISSAII